MYVFIGYLNEPTRPPFHLFLSFQTHDLLQFLQQINVKNVMSIKCDIQLSSWTRFNKLKCFISMYQSYTKMYLTPALGLRYFKLHLPVENEVGK